MAFRWVLRGKPLESEESNHSGYPDIVKNLVTQRGIPENEIESFLHPKLRDLADPFLIPEMELAVTRILEAVDQKQSVCIYGDYDVDGVSSITLLSKILNAYGIQTRTFIPRRGVEGYGLSFAAIERCMSEGTKPDLLITVDCGTVSIDEIAHLRAQKLGHALLKKRPTDLELKDLLDLTAVATISDIVPMIGENRILVRHGLKRLASSSNPGLQALKEITGIKELPTSMDVGFRIGPRLNAAGRMDFPEDALATLTTTCQIEATTLANKLEQYNRQRQDFEKQIRDDAMEQLSNFNPSNDPVIVIGSRDWHHGVVGIIASRLMRQYYKPTFVIAIDENGIGKGSGRSIEGVSLVDAIRNCEDELIAGGGHAMAAGLSIHEDSLDRFKEKFASFVLENSSEEDRMPRLVYDAEIDFSELSLKFLDSYELLQPFGNCNPQPIFVSRGVELCGTPIQMKNNHLRLKMRQAGDEKSAVYFGGGDRDLPPTPWDIAFTIDRNNFRGNTSLQIVIQDIIASKSV